MDQAVSPRAAFSVWEGERLDGGAFAGEDGIKPWGLEPGAEETRGLGRVRACASADAWARADGRLDVRARAPATARPGHRWGRGGGWLVGPSHRPDPRPALVGLGLSVLI